MRGSSSVTASTACRRRCAGRPRPRGASFGADCWRIGRALRRRGSGASIPPRLISRQQQRPSSRLPSRTPWPPRADGRSGRNGSRRRRGGDGSDDGSPMNSTAETIGRWPGATGCPSARCAGSSTAAKSDTPGAVWSLVRAYHCPTQSTLFPFFVRSKHERHPTCWRRLPVPPGMIYLVLAPRPFCSAVRQAPPSGWASRIPGSMTALARSQRRLPN